MISFLSGSAPSAIDGQRPDANAGAYADCERFDPRSPALPNPTTRFATTNIVAIVGQSLRPEVVARAALRLGFDRMLLERALRAGIPGLLAVLNAFACKPTGARALHKVLAKQELGALMSLAGHFGNDKRSLAVVVRGASSLASLLGEGNVAALSHTVSRYAGLDLAESRCVVGLLGAITLGVLEHQRRTKGLEAEGLQQLLVAQQDHIDQAIPNCFAEFLRETGILARAAHQHPSLYHAARTCLGAV